MTDVEITLTEDGLLEIAGAEHTVYGDVRIMFEDGTNVCVDLDKQERTYSLEPTIFCGSECVCQTSREDHEAGVMQLRFDGDEMPDYTIVPDPR